MSRTFSVACKDCRVHLWIGQKSANKGHLYSGQGNLIRLYNFFDEHEGHNLLYGNNCEGEISEFTEIESDDN